MDQIFWGQFKCFAYISPTLRVPYALVSRSKDNAKGRRNVGVWQAKGAERLLIAYKWFASDLTIIKDILNLVNKK